MTYFKPAPRFLLVAWLALLLAGIVRGDLVNDLVFEPEAMSETSGSDAVSEEPDNGAEHLLVPSQRAAQGADVAFLHISSPGDGITQVLPVPRFHITRRPHASLIEFKGQPPP